MPTTAASVCSSVDVFRSEGFLVEVLLGDSIERNVSSFFSSRSRKVVKEVILLVVFDINVGLVFRSELFEFSLHGLEIELLLFFLGSLGVLLTNGLLDIGLGIVKRLALCGLSFSSGSFTLTLLGGFENLQVLYIGTSEADVRGDLKRRSNFIARSSAFCSERSNIAQSDVLILRVDVVQNTFISDIRLGNNADFVSIERRSLARLGCRVGHVLSCLN
jgi:hypothetical protein